MATRLDPALNPDIFGMQPQMLRQPSLQRQTPMQSAESRLQSVESDIEKNLKQQAEFAGQEAMQRQTMAQTEAAGKAEILRERADVLRQAEAPVRAAEEERMKARFEPTRENATEMAAMYSLIGVLGFAIGRGGKQSAMNAMSAMNGMLEGYRQGSTDRYNAEKKMFDTNLKQLTDNINTLTNQLQRVTQLSTIDKAAAEQELAVTLAQSGADFVRENINKFGLPATLKYLQQVQAGAQRAVQKERDAELKAQQRAEDAARRADEARQRALDRMAMGGRRELMVDPKTGKTYSVDLQTGKTTEVQTPEGVTGLVPTRGRGVSPSGAGGAVQFRYNAAMTNAGNALSIELQNAASLPLAATPPAAAEVLTNPAKGLTDAARSFFAQKITSEEARAMQQTFAGMQRAITTIEASGRLSGATEGAIKEFGKTMPRAGDNRINTYLFLAQAKQVMDILVKDLKASGGTDTQIGQAEQARDDVYKVINWTVKDINDILAKKDGRRLVDQQVQESIKKSENLSQFEKNVKAKQAGQTTGETWSSADEARLQELERKARGTE